MQIPKFDPKELEAVGKTPATPFSPELKIFNSPVSMRDAYYAMKEKGRSGSVRLTPYLYTQDCA
jgi:hypothetical protein